MTIEEISELLRQLEIEHGELDGKGIHFKFQTRNFQSTGLIYQKAENSNRKGIIFNLGLEKNGTIFVLRAPDAINLRGSPHLDAVLKLCSLIQRRDPLVQFEYIDDREAIRASIELPLLDNTLTATQLDHCIRALYFSLENWHEHLQNALQNGSVDGIPYDWVHAAKAHAEQKALATAPATLEPTASKVSPLIKRVFDSAKCHAIASRGDLGHDAIVVGLALLREDPEIAPALANCLHTDSVHWPAELLDQATLAAMSADDDLQKMAFKIETRLKAAYNAFLRGGSRASFPLFLEFMLKTPLAKTCPEVMMLLSAQKKNTTPPKPSPMITVDDDALTEDPEPEILARLEETHARGRKVEEFLGREVIGQPDAIRMLARSYTRTLRQPAKGLRGIFTFMGPPGVGKTLLAQRFAEALTKVEKQKYGTLKFSMEMGEDSISIFSAIRSRVGENVPQVIVFDEIEKASPSTIQSLLTMLNDGCLPDGADSTDLSGCFVIFTTNIGQEYFASRNRSGILRGRSFSAEELFDLLGTARLRENFKFDNAPSILSPEFVSRLRKGGAVLFNQLSGTDYIRLLENILGREPAKGSSLPRLSMDGDSKKLLVFSLLPDISPRRVGAEAGTMVSRWTEELLGNKPANFVGQAAKSFRFALRSALEKESRELLSGIQSNHQLKILVVDNDRRMRNILVDYAEKSFAGITTHVNRVEDPAETINEILLQSPDLLLLDLDLPDANLPKGGILELHRRIVVAAPELPIVLFSESPDWEAKIPALFAQGGARAFIAFHFDSADYGICEEEKESLRQILEEALFEKTMSDLVRKRRRLEVSHRFEFDPNSGIVSILLYHLRSLPVVSLAENSGGIRPAEVPSVTFDDVYGLDRAKERLRDAIRFMANPGQLHKFGIKAPSGYLLAGPSGTGKTHLARAVANEAGFVFYSLSAGELVSKWVGESEERLRNLFAAARKYAPSVLFLDEVDSIAGKRTSSPSNSEHYARLLNQLLVCMDGFADTKGSVLILGATNRPEALDPAVLRPGRFDEIIRIEAPGPQAREQMFLKRLEKMSPESGLKDAIPELICRTAGMSPAELDRILREAAYLAARQNRNHLTRADLEAACNLVRYGAERPDVVLDGKDRRRVAWHEAGHAVAQLTLFPGSKLDYVSIVPNEAGALGFAAWQVDESRTNQSADDFRCLIMVALAGREAEKFCPDVGKDAMNTGASNDLERATAMAWDAVTRFGFDESVGPLSIHGLPENLHGAFAHHLKPQVEAFLRDCQKKTAALMEEKKESLNQVAQVLERDQALTGKMAAQIISQKK